MNPEKNWQNGNKMDESPRRIDKVALDVASWWKKTFIFVEKTEVATWKGALILTFAAGAVVSTIWGYSAGVFQESFAGTSTSLFFTVPENPIRVGDSFDVEAVINSDNENIVAVKAMINFDKASFELQSVDTAGSVFAVDNPCTYDGKFCQIITPVAEANASGQVSIVLAKPEPGINSEGALLAVLNFKALALTDPGANNFTYTFAGAGNYSDSDMIVAGNDGSDTLDMVTNAEISVVPDLCTDFTYSDFGACQPGGTQSRTVVSSLPIGCAGGSPILTQECAFVAPTCTSFTYSAFGACQPDNTQSRTVATSSPENCTGGDPALTQACTYVPPVEVPDPVTCTDFTYSEFGACQPDNTQSRTIASSSPEGCTGGSPVLSQSCAFAAPVCVSFTYSEYGACQPNGTQTRTVASSSPSGCRAENPELQRDCTPTEAEEGAGEVTDSDRPIKIEGEKKKFGKSDSFYSKDRKISFQGESSDIKNGKVKIYEGSDLKEEVSADGEGKWKTSVKMKKDGNFKFKLEYYTSAGEKVAESKKYAVKIDTEDPEFTDLPLALNKKRGDKIWWKAKDDGKIEEYKVEFLGKIKRSDRESFSVPANAPKGLHVLKVTAYDKAGNSASRRVTIWVR